MDDGGRCSNCECLDWVVDYHSGFSACAECGCCDSDRILVCTQSYKATFADDGNRLVGAGVSESYPNGAIVTTMAAELATILRCNSNSPPYKRQTYFSERISQWRMLEPEISATDMQQITDEWHTLTGRYDRSSEPVFIGAEWYWDSDWQQRCDYVLNRDQCRQLLWGIDTEIQRPLGESGKPINKPYFVKKYLEKFFSIRHKLCGVSSYGAKASGELLIFLRDMFARLQVPFETIVRVMGERYSFPNYNFCMRRLFDLYGVPHYCTDFPPLKSKKKREEIVLMWLRLVTFLRWPYINSDGEHWGASYQCDIASVRQRKRNRRNAAHANKKVQSHKQHKPTAGSSPHTSDCATKLRWGDPNDPCENAAAQLRDTETLDVSLAFFCPTSFDGVGVRDDDYYTI